MASPPLIPDALYSQIRRSMPIACVDLVVRDAPGRILLVRRRNDPAKGEWWFPGGRVHFMETRLEAARRKLAEECGLAAGACRELGTWDVIFQDQPADGAAHGVTTVYLVEVERQVVHLDDQSAAFEWRLPEDWRRDLRHPFTQDVLGRLAAFPPMGRAPIS